MSNDYNPGIPSAGLSPAMIQQMLISLMNSSQLGQFQQQPVGDLSQLTFGYDPSQMQQSSMIQLPGTSDERDVGSIEEAQKQGNFAQDLSDLATDPIYAAMMGGGGFAADAFAPNVTRELIPRPATDRFNQWLMRDDGSLESEIAKRVQGGSSPRQVISDMRQIVNRFDKADENDPNYAQLQADAEQIQMMLATTGRVTDETTGQPLPMDARIDWNQTYSDVTDLLEPYYAEQTTQPGPIGEVRGPDGELISSGGEIIQGDDGQLYRQTTEDSPLAEQFHELGIPLPTESYNEGDILGSDWVQADQDYRASQDSFNQTQDQLRDQEAALNQRASGPLEEEFVSELIRQWNGGQPQTGAATTSTTGAVTNVQPDDTDDSSFSDWWNQSAEGDSRLDDPLHSTAIPAANAAGSWFRDLFSGAAAGPQTVAGGTDMYGMPTTSSTGGTGLEGAIESIPADVGQAGLTDLNVLAGPNSVTARGIDNWWDAIAAGGENAVGATVGGFDPLGSIGNWTGGLWQDWTGANDEPPNQAGVAPTMPTGGTELQNMKPHPGQYRAIDDPAWQSLINQQLANSTASPEHQPLPALGPQDLANIFTNDPGAGGGGAGGAAGPRTISDLTGVPEGQQPGVPPGGYVHNGAIFDAQDRLVGYLPQQYNTPGQPPVNPNVSGPPMPQTGTVDWSQSVPAQTSNATSRTGPEPSEGVRPAPTIQQLLAMMGQQPTSNTSTRTGPEPSEGVRTSNASTRTGPEPSEGVGQRQTPDAMSTQTMLEMLFPGTSPRRASGARTSGGPGAGGSNDRVTSGPQGGGRQALLSALWPGERRNNASTRTGPEPSEGAGRQALLRMLWPGQEGSSARRGSSDRDESPGPVDTYRAGLRSEARELDRQGRQGRYDQNMAYRERYGRDYWQARGYTQALARMGINPTAVALNTRMGGLNTMRTGS